MAWPLAAGLAGAASMKLARPAKASRDEAPALRPEHAQILQRKIERSRAFPHLLSSPKVDWSPRAARRRGWKAPLTPLRNPHERHGASVAGAEGTMAAAADTDTTVLRIAFIRIDFLADRAGGETTGDGRFDLTGPDLNLPSIDRPPRNRRFYLDHLEALRRYYDVQSFGQVKIEGDVWPRSDDGAYSVTDMADFGPWRFSPEIYRAAVHMFRSMLIAADTQATKVLNDPIPWGDYDRFMIIHAGSDFQSDLRQDSPLDIPSFTIGVSDTDVVHFGPDSVDRAAIIPETASQDGFYGALNGVIAHENGHNLFGLADLYDVETGFPVVGLWSLMDSGNLAGSPVLLPNGEEIFATGLLPPSLDPFQRFFVGERLNFEEPSWGVDTPLENVERNADVRRIFQSSDEYLLLENRHIAPGQTIDLEQDSVSRVILGPADPYEYDALLPGPGLLVWHIDASVVPFETAFRPNPDFGWNTNPVRRGVSVIEADGLADLGDPGSRFILGSYRDPFFLSNRSVLSDTTQPNLIPHIGTRPHVRIDVLDDPGPTMRFRASRAWQPPSWPVAADFPPGGPLLLGADVDGNGVRDVAWAGGAVGSPDSTAVFVVRGNGTGIRDTSAVLARLPARPRQPLAAIEVDELSPYPPGSLFAVTTMPDSAGVWVPGKVFLLSRDGAVMPGWPARIPAAGPVVSVTTAPVIAGFYPNVTVYVGASDGRVYAIGLDGQVRGTSDAPAAAEALVSGRLAVDPTPPGMLGNLVAYANGAGTWVVHDNGGPNLTAQPGWPKRLFDWRLQAVASSGASPRRAAFATQDTIPEPDFLWIDFDGGGSPAGTDSVCAPGRTLVVHVGDRLWAFCAKGQALPGWGKATGDTIVTGLAAGDPDGDGYAEVLTQSRTSGVAFWNQTGSPSAGWPKTPTRESFPTDSPPLCFDVTGDARGEVIAMNASGVVTALTADGRVPEGWPLATGAGAIGSMAAADFDGDGFLDLVAPDRDAPDSLEYGVNGRVGTLYLYSLPIAQATGRRTAWTMLGGDPGRTATLTSERSPVAGAPSPGPYVTGSLKVYPNPARRQPVAFSYQLTEPARVEIRIVDASGREVAAFERDGRRADNLEVWDPAGTPAGLYLARIRFQSGSQRHEEVIPVGVLR